MSDKRWNISTILCGECDKEITNIQNIFDILYIDDSNTASFNIVTFINAIRCDEQKFGLYYYIEKLEKKSCQMAYVCNSRHQRAQSEEEQAENEFPETRIEGVTIKSTRFRISDFYFPGEGNYELMVYKYDDNDVQPVDRDNNGDSMRFAEEEHLVAVYPFKVLRK